MVSYSAPIITKSYAVAPTYAAPVVAAPIYKSYAAPIIAAPIVKSYAAAPILTKAYAPAYGYGGYGGYGYGLGGGYYGGYGYGYGKY